MENGRERNLFDITGFAAAAGEKNVIARPLNYQIRHGLARLQCMIVRRSALFKAGLFESGRRIDIYEDQDLACRLALLGPWRVNRTPLARIMRDPDPATGLSESGRRDPVRALNGMVRIYDQLLNSTALMPEERGLVNKTLSSYEGMLGFELIRAGEIGKARRILWKSMRVNPSFGARMRYLLGMLPERIAPIAAEQWRTMRG